MNGIEGDINLSSARNKWYEQIKHEETIKLLNEDARYFLHQSMSTPCLDVLSSCEGIYLVDINGKKSTQRTKGSIHNEWIHI